MTSSNIRSRARQTLAGRWGIAVLAAFLASLLGGLATGSGGRIEIDKDMLNSLPRVVRAYIAVALSFGGILGLAQFILGGVVQLGYSRFLLDMHDGKGAEVSDLFSQFDRFGDGFCLSLLRSIFIFLWSLLLVIPGIIASLSYSMAHFIMVENPNMTAREALKASKELMDGYKWDLFCLNLSFIGWILLCILTLGIGYLWLDPYMNAAHAAFYRSIRAGEKALEEG